MRRLVFLFVLGTASISASVAAADPPESHEVLEERPSGFWTSNRPAVGGAYRYRLLGIGVVLVAITGFSMRRMLKRASAEREAGFAGRTRPANKT